jgi:thioredoxin 1
MFPVLDEISMTQDKLKITKLSVEDAPEVARTYGIKSIPAMLVFEDGAVVQTILGPKTYEKLSEELKDFI